MVKINATAKFNGIEVLATANRKSTFPIGWNSKASAEKHLPSDAYTVYNMDKAFFIGLKGQVA